MDSASSPLPQDDLPLEQQVARLQALLEATRQVHSSIAVSEVLTRASHILVRELEMEGALFLDPSSAQPKVSWGTVPAAPYDSCYRFPLFSRENQLLAELIVAPPADGSLSIYDRDFIEGLVLQTAVALENATLHERDLEWARVQQDLDAARTIQRSLFPTSMPAIPGFSIGARSSTCYEVGGDYLDILRLEDGTHLMVVADVAGKGLASAIVATSFRASFRSLAGQPLPLAELAARIGQRHWEEGPEARRLYVTAIFLRLRTEDGIVEIVNAGHNPGALARSAGSVHLFKASGTPLGMFPGMSYSSETFPFPAGSRLLFYTDGLTEVSQGEEEFGSERLVQAFLESSSSNAPQILESLWETLASFSTNAPQVDDMTALAICHLDPLQQELATP
jgi:sigma-B regulation protein RsbU (phosphoserine phosphatase)